MITGKVGSADVMSIASIYLSSSSSSCSYPGLTIAFLGGVTQRSIMLRRPGAPLPPIRVFLFPRLRFFSTKHDILFFTTSRIRRGEHSSRKRTSSLKMSRFRMRGAAA